jgi:hypothetical protein
LGSLKRSFWYWTLEIFLDQGTVMPCITISIQLEHYMYVFLYVGNFDHLQIWLGYVLLINV